MRYGRFKYAGGKYGTDSAQSLIQWGFIVDWQGLGWAAEYNEAERMIDLNMVRGRDNYVKPNGSGLERYQPGVITAVFDNEDGRYDPYNTSSPLYPNVMPGKLADVRVRDGTGTIRTLMRGKVSDIQTFRRSGRELAMIRVVDGLGFLKDQIVTIGLAGGQVDSRVHDYILPAAGWPDVAWRGWPIWTGNPVTKLIQQWAIRNQNALEAIEQLADVELGQFVHQKDGYGRLMSSQLTYRETITITEEECLRDISFPSPWEVIRNEVTVMVYPRRYVIVNAVVFELDQVIPLANGESVTLECELTYANYPTIGQYLTYDVELWTDSDGTGTNLGYSIESDPNPGFSTWVTITNTSGLPGYLTHLDIEAQNVSYVRNPSSVTAVDTDSQATYGRRTLVLDTPWMADADYAQECADWLLDKLKDPQPWPVIQIEHRSDLQFQPELYSSRIKLEIPSKNIDGYYRVGKIEHQWLSENGQAVRTTFKLEPYFDIFVK